MRYANSVDEKLANAPAFSELLDDIVEQKNRGGKLAVSFVNPFSYPIVAESHGLVSSISHFYADGSMLVMLHNIFRRGHISRVSFDFSSIAEQAFRAFSGAKLNVALVGAAEHEIVAAAEYISSLVPDIKIVYVRNGYFNNGLEKEACYQQMESRKVDVVICGMGTPHQETFIIDALKEVSSLRAAFTCGGFFTQTAIKGDYYHPIVKKFGLRWLQRMIMHSHVRRRVLLDYPWFVIRYLLGPVKCRESLL